MLLYNTLSRTKEELRPIHGKTVGVYSCGPTVYGYAHIGNMRTYIFADVLQRALEMSGYRVKRVMNITDVGHLTGDTDDGTDKLEQGAAREQKTVWEVAQLYADAFFADAEKLNIAKPKKIVRATETIKDQIALIAQLVASGYAYDTDQAVYFDVATFKTYGALSGQSLAEKQVASRSDVVTDPQKRNPADFALWFKRVGRHKDHVMHWDSPWGDGFPGWHIECSAISAKELGQPFDIHTGGIDHIGTHHTNEIAQSEAATGMPLAHIWMHGEFLVFDKQKMAKSDGNIVTVSTLVEKGFNPLAFRYLVLSAHYRSPLSFSWDSMEQAQQAYDHVVRSVARILASPKQKKSNEAQSFIDRFRSFIQDDLDTPHALSLLHEALDSSSLAPSEKKLIISTYDEILGVRLISSAEALLDSVPKGLHKEAVNRQRAREAGDYATADTIRLSVEKKGYSIDDLSDGDFVVLPMQVARPKNE